MYIPSFALPIYKTACHANPYLCHLYRSVQYRYLSTVCVLLASLINMWWILVYRTLRKVTSTNMRKNMYVTPRRAAAAPVVSAVVLRRPAKEYTHPCSMMHPRLSTAGIEVAPHYRQLLV